MEFSNSNFIYFFINGFNTKSDAGVSKDSLVIAYLGDMSTTKQQRLGNPMEKKIWKLKL